MDYEEFVAILLSQSRLFANCSFDFQDPFLLGFWYDALKDLNKAQLLKAFGDLIKTERFFPSVADIRKAAIPKALGIDGNAIDITARIVQAISKFGYMRGKDAREFIGEIGWKVIASRGGWDTVCCITNKELSTFSAQCREQAKVLVEKSIYDLALEENKLLMEESVSNPMLQSALDLAMSGSSGISVSI